MKFSARIFFNSFPEEGWEEADHWPFLDGYQEGDPLIESFYALKIESDSPLIALSEVFGVFNQDRRPNIDEERSLSVGDVIALQSPEGAVTFWAVERVGFKRISQPKFREDE